MFFSKIIAVIMAFLSFFGIGGAIDPEPAPEPTNPIVVEHEPEPVSSTPQVVYKKSGQYTVYKYHPSDGILCLDWEDDGGENLYHANISSYLKKCENFSVTVSGEFIVCRFNYTDGSSKTLKFYADYWRNPEA